MQTRWRYTSPLRLHWQSKTPTALTSEDSSYRVCRGVKILRYLKWPFLPCKPRKETAHRKHDATHPTPQLNYLSPQTTYSSSTEEISVSSKTVMNKYYNSYYNMNWHQRQYVIKCKQDGIKGYINKWMKCSSRLLRQSMQSRGYYSLRYKKCSFLWNLGKRYRITTISHLRRTAAAQLKIEVSAQRSRTFEYYLSTSVSIDLNAGSCRVELKVYSGGTSCTLMEVDKIVVKNECTVATVGDIILPVYCISKLQWLIKEKSRYVMTREHYFYMKWAQLHHN